MVPRRNGEVETKAGTYCKSSQNIKVRSSEKWIGYKKSMQGSLGHWGTATNESYHLLRSSSFPLAESREDAQKWHLTKGRKRRKKRSSVLEVKISHTFSKDFICFDLLNTHIDLMNSVALISPNDK